MRQKLADISEATLRSLYLEERKSQEEIAAILGCSDTSIWRRMRKYGIPLRSKAEAGIKTFRQDFDGDAYLKAYILGFCKGDVYPWKRDKNSQTIRLMTNTTKIEQADLFKSLFAPYGYIYENTPEQSNIIHLVAYVNMSMDFLLAEKDHVPEWIIEDQEIFFAFFAGYTDAEAHIGVHSGYAIFKLDSCDKQIILQSHEMLKDAGILGPVPFICATRGYTNKNGHAYHNEMWRLQVGAKSAMLMLFDRIRPYLKHAKRIQDMEAAIENIEIRNRRQQQRRDKRRSAHAH
ncbi:MAG: AsnC family protein [Chloroflexota bacterium]